MKKEEMRFTIRFNPADPRHRNAARILNEAGRSKAVIVANALWGYDAKRDAEPDPGKNIPVRENAGIADSAQDSQPKIPEPPDGDVAANLLQDAVLSGLSRFRAD